MTEEQSIDILRHALAAIWTIVEYDGTTEDCWRIAEEALQLTNQFASKGKYPSNSVGLESWVEYRERKKI